MKKNPTQKNQTKETAVPHITSLEELQAMCRKSMRLEFEFQGQQIAVNLRRLTPAEDAQITAIATVLPPVIRGKTSQEDRHDFNDLEFIRRKTEADIEARAVALYLAVPMFAEAQPGLKDRKAIVDFIQSQFDEQVLTVLWNAVREGEVKSAELVNIP